MNDLPLNKLQFRSRSRIIRTIGDRLISGPVAAVIELVKNAHDADADSVVVKFYPPLRKGQGTITVADDGHGMSFMDIQTKWMEPATSDKVERRLSPGKRTMLGSKGIGRFASARLGDFMKLRTSCKDVSSGEFETTEINVDWAEFERSEYLEEVYIPYTQSNDVTKSGTLITINSLRDDWTRDSLNILHKQLRRLISPLTSQLSKYQFNIYLDLSLCTIENCGFDGSEIVNGLFPNSKDGELNLVRPWPIMDASDYKILGTFNPDGEFHGEMFFYRAGDQVSKKFDLRIPVDKELSESSCGVVDISLYIFDRESEAIDSLIERAGLKQFGKREARHLLDEIAGIGIYRNGFRIRPYGEPNQDWLNLDARRVQDPSKHIGNNQVLGIVEVQDEYDSGLVERSSREGLEDNPQYRRLVRLLSTLLDERVEEERRAYREKIGVGVRKSKPFSDVYKSADMAWAKDIISLIPARKRNTAKAKVRRATERLKNDLRDIQERQAKLESKVTLGSIVAEVLHEGRAPVSAIHREAQRLLEYFETLFDTSDEALRKRSEVPGILTDISDQSERLRRLFRILSPLSGRRRGPPKAYPIKSTIDDAIKLYRPRLEKLRVATNISLENKTLKSFGYRDDLIVAISNLIENSLYWFEAKQTKNPEINFSIEIGRKELSLDISDNGPGIPEDFKDKVFDVGFSLRPRGTGLGLSIAQEALSRSNGEIELIAPKPRCTFRITLPAYRE